MSVIEVVVVDGRGRIVVPRRVRDRLGISKGSRLLLVQVGEDTLVLRRLNVRELLEAIAREVRESGIDLEGLEREIETEANRAARKRIEEILAGH
ncbi:MAG TPA: AbrB/MazE/SpoVT family DNA-binding domain-containing protein [Candidatus Korarchaeota archaeon]|nr:AbrB/MazE/SpoVT family DNA-binding domain-containing protein [Candidatus Korarchaeota archaeon]